MGKNYATMKHIKNNLVNNGVFITYNDEQNTVEEQSYAPYLGKDPLNG